MRKSAFLKLAVELNNALDCSGNRFICIKITKFWNELHKPEDLYLYDASLVVKGRTDISELELVMTLAERTPACKQRVLQVRQSIMAEKLKGIGKLNVQVLPKVYVLLCA